VKRVYSVVGLLLLFVVAAFVPVLFWVYVGVGGFLVAAVLVKDHFVAQRPVGARVLAAGRMRRFMRRANVRDLKFWRLLPSKKMLLVFVGFSVAALLVGAVIGASLVRIRNVGTIRAVGVEVYADAGLSTVLHEISWGILNPGESKTFNAWVQNSGNVAQGLTLSTEGWSPLGAGNSISLSWDYDGAPVPAGASIPVVFTLSVSPSITGVSGFSFDVVIQVTG
jgi:hypothetical protein